MATSNLAKRRSFALRSTFIFIRKILSVLMFSVEVGREETGWGGGEAVGHSISNYFPFISKMIDCKLLLLEIFADVATVSRKR